MKKKLLSIERIFFLFILFIVIVLSGAFFITAYLSIKNLGEDLYQDLVESKAFDIKKIIEQRIDNDLMTIRTYARLPVVINSVMHIGDAHFYFKDFIDELLILGKKADYKLLDVDGLLIEGFHSFKSSEVQKLKKPHWVDKVIEGVIPYYAEFFIQQDKTYMRYAVPVRHYNSIEGVLVAEKEFNISKTLQEVTQEQNIISTDIFDSKQVFVHFEKKRSKEFLSKKVLLKGTQAFLDLQIETGKLKTSLKDFIYTIILASVLIGFILLILFKRIGEKLFFKPQELLNKTNQRLTQANSELEQFAYRSSHDIKAPITTIKGLVSYMKVDLSKGDLKEVETNISKIINEASRLELLVTDILELAVIDVKNMQLEKIDFNEIVQSIKENLNLQVEKRNVKITCESDLGQPFYTSRVRIFQILENLILNSIKYSDDKKDRKFVRVRSFERDDGVHIILEDNGLGFPKESHGKVFKLFKRFHPKVSKGSGFGLAIVKKHVDFLKGSIHFKSSEGEGTLFEIILPRKQEIQRDIA